MLRYRFVYSMVLMSVIAFFICFDGYLSYYIMIASLVFPFASLLVSLPSMLGVRAALSLDADRARKGSALSLQITLRQKIPFIPSGRAKVTLEVENHLTGVQQTEVFWFTAVDKPLTLSHLLTSPACGQVTCRLKKARVYDYAGLFVLPLYIKDSAGSVLFFPATHPARLGSPSPEVPSADEDAQFSPRPGDDPSELFGLRDYREGDRASRIHWKLSEKTGQTLVKELSYPVEKRPLFLLELNGTGPELDALLDVFCTLSFHLLGEELPHRAAFAVGEDLEIYEIDSADTLTPVLEDLLTRALTGPLPALWSGSLPVGVSHAVYLTCSPAPEAAALLHAASDRVSTVAVCEQTDKAPAAEKVVRPGRIAEDLTGFEV